MGSKKKITNTFCVRKDADSFPNPAVFATRDDANKVQNEWHTKSKRYRPHSKILNTHGTCPPLGLPRDNQNNKDEPCLCEVARQWQWIVGGAKRDDEEVSCLGYASVRKYIVFCQISQSPNTKFAELFWKEKMNGFCCSAKMTWWRKKCAFDKWQSVLFMMAGEISASRCLHKGTTLFALFLPK